MCFEGRKSERILHMIKIGICDDEKIVLSVLGTLVKQSLEELEEGGKIINFHSGEELLEEAEKLDVLFLDIEMPGLDGIEVGSQIQKRNLDCKVIMATSRQDRFKEAFKINAFRFITKPFQKSEVKESLEDVLKTRVGMEKIEVYRERVPYKLYQKDIMYMEAVDSSVEFVLRDGVFRKETSLKQLEKELDDRLFFRVNKQYIVNMKYIDIHTYKDGIIQVGAAKIRVSVRKKKEFEKAYTVYDINYR